MLDTKTTFDDVVVHNAGSPQQAQAILDNRLYRNISDALGGTQEYMAMEKLYELHQEGRFDLIVVDTPPTRHALDFLDAPARLVRFLDNRIFRLLMMPTRASLRALSVATRLFLRTVSSVVGQAMVADTVAFFAAFEGMEEGFRDRAARVEVLLADEGTAFVVVAAPRRDAVTEALYFADRLRDRSERVGALVVNRMFPFFGAVPEVGPGTARAKRVSAGGGGTPAGGAASRAAGRPRAAASPRQRGGPGARVGRRPHGRRVGRKRVRGRRRGVGQADRQPGPAQPGGQPGGAARGRAGGAPPGHCRWCGFRSWRTTSMTSPVSPSWGDGCLGRLLARGDDQTGRGIAVRASSDSSTATFFSRAAAASSMVSATVTMRSKPVVRSSRIRVGRLHATATSPPSSRARRIPPIRAPRPAESTNGIPDMSIRSRLLEAISARACRNWLTVKASSSPTGRQMVKPSGVSSWWMVSHNLPDRHPAATNLWDRLAAATKPAGPPRGGDPPMVPTRGGADTLPSRA